METNAASPLLCETIVPAAEPVDILIVDDLQEKALIYKTMLEELGQNLVFAHSGAEALRLVLKHEFAVILLDVNMPGMDGFETASLIRGRKKSSRTPIIFLTAFTDEMHMAQGYASGAVDYLPTPVVPEILKAKVKVFIELFQMRQQATLRAEERARRTAAEESARRSEFLVKVSETLALSRNPQEVLTGLIQLSMPALADMAAVRLNAGAGEAESLECVSTGNNQCTAFDAILEEHPKLKLAAEQVRTTGHHQLVEGDFPGDIHAALFLPLMLKEQSHGLLFLGRKEVYQKNDVSLARAIASRASVALENAMLIERIQEADRRKNEFIATLAHELRNPLAPISNALQIMKIAGPTDPRIADIREVMQRQVQHMSRLVDDLLDVSRITRAKIELRKEVIGLSAVMESAIETSRSFFEEAGHALIVQLPPQPVLLFGDPTRLSQIFSNLLNNAAKYTEAGGRVSVKAQIEGAFVSVSVKDTGIGIPANMLPRIFDVFTQADNSIARSRGGLGIGLKLVKELCELHGGSVAASSDGPGKGSEFIVCLPICESNNLHSSRR
jgi:signal transduction histidine kinase/CheY-like chemotaxis protein